LEVPGGVDRGPVPPDQFLSRRGGT
jgi:hypothetical protein